MPFQLHELISCCWTPLLHCRMPLDRRVPLPQSASACGPASEAIHIFYYSTGAKSRQDSTELSPTSSGAQSRQSSVSGSPVNR